MTGRHLAETPNALRDLLRGWRDLRGKSQLELSLDTGISQRHLSLSLAIFGQAMIQKCGSEAM
ncbi:MAG: hypothetical protein ACRYG8_49830 [Janthinobacterium lividum]